MYDFDYTEIQNDAEQTAKPNPRKIRWQIIVAIAGTFVLMAGLIWFMFAGIKIIFPDYIAGNNMIKAGGKYIYLNGGMLQYKGGITDDPKDIISADADSTLLSNGKTVYYVEDGNICSVELDGKDAKVICKADGAVSLVHRYHDLLYYISSKENTDKLSLIQLDLKTNAEKEIEGISLMTSSFYVYGDRMYYYSEVNADGAFDIRQFDFKTMEAADFLKNASLCVNIGFGEQPLFCENEKSSGYATALYQIKGDEAEKIADLPEKVTVACAPYGSDEIILSPVNGENTEVINTVLFNIKTGEEKELKTTESKPVYIVQDWAHPKDVYYCSFKSSNEILHHNNTLDMVYRLLDGELRECDVNGSVVFNSENCAVIDGYFVDDDFNGHQIAVKENDN